MTWLIYDGECPFCSNYVAFKEARKSLQGLQLLDARSNFDHPAVAKVRDTGLQLDDGMALVFDDGRVLHGAQVLAALAGETSPLKNAKTSAAIYPWLRSGRNLALRLLGRKQIGY